MFVSVVLNFLTMSQQPQQTDSNNMSEHSRTRNHEVNMNLQKSTPLTHEGQRSTPLVNRGTTHIFYKTRMCQKFVEGTCRNGDGCTFAHGPKDLREPPPNWQELVKDNRGGGNGSGNWNDDKRIIHRMRICRKFYNGDECPYGEKCNFLHESPAKFKVEAAMDIDRARESSVIKIETVVDRSQSQTEAGPDFVTVVNTDQDASRALVKGTYWKTRICSKWETTGQCIYGDKCHYAHGYAELHTPVGRVEGEGHANVNSYADGSISTNVVHGPVIEPASADPVPQIRGRGFLKLANKKLNRIYGDWIDDEDEST